MTNENKTEFQAFTEVHEALSSLDAEARERVLASVATLLGIAAPAKREIDGGAEETDEDDVNAGNDVGISTRTFTEFAELYAAADPSSNSDKALIAAYWLRAYESQANFSGQSVNKILTNLGEKIANITVALSGLISAKPQLVLQLRKTGKSQQSRKTYKLSRTGIKRAEEMIGE